MAKKERKPRTKSFVVEFPLATTPTDEARLGKGLFEAAKRLRNTLLQKGLELVTLMRNDPAWEEARKLPKSSDEQKIARTAAFSAIRNKYNFSDYALQTEMLALRKAAKFEDRIGSHIVQKLANSVYKSLDRYLMGLNGKPRFKGVKCLLHSIEAKTNEANLRWNNETKCLHLARDWIIPGKLPNLAKDEWLWTAMQAPVKYCRIVRRKVKGHFRYYLQLVLEGFAPMKLSVSARLAEKGTTAGIDIGPSNIAWCSETDADFFRFCADVDEPKKIMRRLQRKLDRQNRAKNPDNFNADGTVKKGAKHWERSKAQEATQEKIQTLHAHTAEKRANAHGRDINHLLSKAVHFRHDNVSVKSLQKNYGRSVQARAPGLFMSELQRKAERADGASEKIAVRQLKTSQYDHSTESYAKKKLSERWHIFGDGRGKVQRDVYSAFLALHAIQTTDEEGVIHAKHDPILLENAWSTIAPVLKAKKLFVEMEAKRGTEQKEQHPPCSAVPGANNL